MGSAVEGGQARLAVGADGLGAAVRHPGPAVAGHAALGDDAGGLLGAAAPQRVGQQSLVVAELVCVVAVGAGGVEHGDPGVHRRHDRGDRTLGVAVGVGGQAHTAQADAQLRRGQPIRGHPSSLRPGRSFS